MKTNRVLNFLLICLLLFLLACCRKAPQEPEVRIVISEKSNYVFNNTLDDIEIIQPIQSYVLSNSSWMYPSRRAYFTTPQLSTVVTIPSREKVEVPSFVIPESTCAAQSCRIDAFIYRTKNDPEKVFVSYSTNDVDIEEQLIKTTIQHNADFTFNIENYSDESTWFCWSPYTEREIFWVDWGGNSHLERQTDYGTWEYIPTDLNLCPRSYPHTTVINSRMGIEIPPSEIRTIDGTSAYPYYRDLPKGTYRWVVILFDHHITIFSPAFEWQGSFIGSSLGVYGCMVIAQMKSPPNTASWKITRIIMHLTACPLRCASGVLRDGGGMLVHFAKVHATMVL